MNTALMSELLGGAGRYKALRSLFQAGERQFGTRELAAEAGIDPASASRWLRRWAEVGLLEREVVRGTPLYRVSRDPALAALRQLLQQDSETANVLRERLDALGEKVQAAVIFGSTARGETHAGSDVDLLLIAPKLSRLVAQAHFKSSARKLGRPVNVQVFTPQDWTAALDGGDSFALDVMRSPVIVLKGVLDVAHG